MAHTGYHKHSAYILRHADMPGFSRMEQAHLSLLVLAHRGTMEKMKGQISNSLDLAMVMAMRLAVLFHRSRSDVRMPALEAHCSGRAFRLQLDPQWLAGNALTAAALREEMRECRKLGVSLDVPALDQVGVETETATAE